MTGLYEGPVSAAASGQKTAAKETTGQLKGVGMRRLGDQQDGEKGVVGATDCMGRGQKMGNTSSNCA